jgi:hypothetical protein
LRARNKLRGLKYAFVIDEVEHPEGGERSFRHRFWDGDNCAIKLVNQPC